PARRRRHSRSRARADGETIAVEPAVAHAQEMSRVWDGLGTGAGRGRDPLHQSNLSGPGARTFSTLRRLTRHRGPGVRDPSAADRPKAGQGPGGSLSPDKGTAADP